MKSASLLISFILILTWPAQSQELDYNSAINILTQPAGTEMKNNHDFRVTQSEAKYMIEFNIQFGKKVQTRLAYVKTGKQFEKVSYHWETARKVAVKFYGHDPSDTFELKVFADRKGTGMQVNEEEGKKV